MGFKLTKTVLCLFLIFLIALTLRIIAAYNVDPGTDEIIYSVMGLDFISSGQLSTIGQIPLYFYTLDVIYKVFGLEVWTMRLLNIALGSLAILLLFLIGKELFDKKIGLLSAFLFAVSPFAIMYNIESDMASIFFALLSFLFFVKGFKEQKYFYLSITFLGIAYLFKEIALLLLPAYAIYFCIEYFSQKERRSRFKLINLAVISMLILFILILPVLTHNYLAYQQKGVVDVRVSKYLRLDLEIYKTLGARTTAEEFDFGRSIAFSKGIFNSFLKEDPVIIILSILGVLLLWKKERRKAILLLLLCISVPWLFYTQGDGGHELIFVPFFALLSANVLIFLTEKYLKNTNVKKGAAIVALALIMVVTLVALKEKLSNDTTTLKLIDYAETVPPESIILLDPRVYNAPVVLAFMDKHYLEEPNIARFFEVIREAPGERIPVPLYYIECAWDKPCGWKQKDHDFVASQGEELSKVMTEKMLLDHEVSLNNEVMLRIYKGGINVPLGIYPAIDETHFLFYYPVGWKNKDKIYDAYTPETIPDKVLYALSRTVLHLAFLTALSGIVMVFYLFIKSQKETVKDVGKT